MKMTVIGHMNKNYLEKIPSFAGPLRGFQENGTSFEKGQGYCRQNTSFMDFASAKQGKRLFVKKRRRRTIISSKDLEKLEGLFKISKWPDRIQKGRLSKTIGKSENFISTWFQNRRARMRRLARQKDLLDDVDSSDSNVQSSENRCHKLHKYRTKSTNQRKDDFDETDSASREPVTMIVKQTKNVVEEIDESNSKDTFDGKNEYPGQENTPPAKGKPGGALCTSQGIGKAVVKMKKSPNDVVSFHLVLR